MSSDTPAVVSTELPDEETQNTAEIDSEESPESGLKSSAKNKKGRGRWLLIFFALILLAASAVGGWYFAKEQWFARQAQIGESMDGKLSELQAEITLLQNQVVEQAQRQGNVESSMVAVAQSTESQLLSLAERISKTESTGSGDWELAEAEYLLRIANQRLVTSHDIDGAIEMMGAADGILRALAYPELTEARRQLVADMTKLNLVQPVDYEGIYFALEATLQSVAQLSGSRVEQLTEEQVEDPASSRLGEYWSHIVDALSPYIVINSSGDSQARYLLSDQQESLLKSEIQLQIRQAQLAMLSGEASVYKQALQGAADNIETVFVEAETSGSVAASLRRYSERPISNESLNISRSIRALETIVDQMTRVQSINNNPADQ